MSQAAHLLTFYFVTAAGSALSSIATFLSIERAFGGGYSLGIALTVRTLACCALSYCVNSLISGIGLKRLLAISQVFGLISLIVLWAGFTTANFPSVLVGIILCGLPGTIVIITVVSSLRLLLNGDAFRHHSGRREQLWGVAMLSASLLAPWLLEWTSLTAVLVIDGATFIAALILLRDLNIMTAEVPLAPSSTSSHSLLNNLRALKKAPTKTFLFNSTATLLLAALVPLMASSKLTGLLQPLPELLRESLWSIEAFTIILSGTIYIHLRPLLQYRITELALYLNALTLGFIVVVPSPLTVISVLVLISIGISLGFLKLRDDLMLAAGDAANDIHSHSAIANLHRNLVLSASPLILVWLFNRLDFPIATLALLTAQAVLVTLGFVAGRTTT